MISKKIQASSRIRNGKLRKARSMGARWRWTTIIVYNRVDSWGECVDQN